MSKPQRASFAVATLALLLVVATQSSAQVDWIYAASGGRYAVFDTEAAAVVAEGVVSAETVIDSESTPVIIPTPGGRFVFFLYADHDLAIVMDAETHLPVRELSLPPESVDLQFSSMGNEIYVRTRYGSWSVFPHSRGDIVGGSTPARGLGDNRVAFNRRATRVYGNGSGSLLYLLTSSGKSVREIALDSGPYDWTTSPNFRYLLGSGEDGIVLVDEQRGRAVGYVDGSFKSALFDSASSRIFALGGSGKEIIAFETRRFREVERFMTPVEVEAIWEASDGRVHGFAVGPSGGDGSLVLDILGNAREIPFPGSLGSRTLPITAAMVTLKPGQGFACF